MNFFYQCCCTRNWRLGRKMVCMIIALSYNQMFLSQAVVLFSVYHLCLNLLIVQQRGSKRHSDDLWGDFWIFVYSYTPPLFLTSCGMYYVICGVNYYYQNWAIEQVTHPMPAQTQYWEWPGWERPQYSTLYSIVPDKFYSECGWPQRAVDGGLYNLTSGSTNQFVKNTHHWGNHVCLGHSKR